SAGGNTNTVSERLNSRAIACIAAVSSPSGSSTTASGLPAKRFSVNTSSVTKRRRIRISSNLVGRKQATWINDLLLRLDQQDLARSGLGGPAQYAEHRRGRPRHGFGRGA